MNNFLAVVGRLLPVPGLGRQRPACLIRAVPGWQLGHVPEHRRTFYGERHRVELYNNLLKHVVRSWRRTRS